MSVPPPPHTKCENVKMLEKFLIMPLLSFGFERITINNFESATCHERLSLLGNDWLLAK